MKIFTIATLLLLLTVSFAATAEKSALEQLFEQQQYDAFLQQAQQQAAENNAEALFLLGKAYHLGRGVTQDNATASQYYEQARALGSARASHNLGSMALDNDRKTQAIPLLEEALARGLKLPTLYTQST
ncbi:SEL1-like repeat protein [Shewanella sp. SM101]|uniref:SEL1-like repeat protein n=1 Tax=Shewanella sp. SM101 TaxID=2912789 RepID=UPI0021D84962|nr:SEL1-like repeat protein [Shewanella sp. SM101]MCU8107149.1 SEL1-like repeat protein [Shewanella sp. SM101]